MSCETVARVNFENFGSLMQHAVFARTSGALQIGIPTWFAVFVPTSHALWTPNASAGSWPSSHEPHPGALHLLILPSLSFSLSFSLSLLLLILDRTDVCSPLLRLFPTQFRAKIDFSRKKGENLLLCSHCHTAAIAGPTCLIAHLLVPYDRGFSPISMLFSTYWSWTPYRNARMRSRTTVRIHGIGTGISEASKRVPIADHQA